MTKKGGTRNTTLTFFDLMKTAIQLITVDDKGIKFISIFVTTKKEKYDWKRTTKKAKGRYRIKEDAGARAKVQNVQRQI